MSSNTGTPNTPRGFRTEPLWIDEAERAEIEARLKSRESKRDSAMREVREARVLRRGTHDRTRE